MIIHLENNCIFNNKILYKVPIANDEKFIKLAYYNMINMPKNNIYDKNYKSKSFLFNKIHSSIEPDNADLNSNELFKYFKNLRII